MKRKTAALTKNNQKTMGADGFDDAKVGDGGADEE